MARLIPLCAFIVMSLFGGPVMAAEPLEITADKGLEWHRDQKKIIARGNVVASQGEASINSAIMTATYKEGTKANKFIPQSLTAEQNVEIKTADGTAHGDKAIYNIAEETAIMTGQDLRLVSKELTLRADENFEYFIKQGKLLANGHAKLTQMTDKGENTIEADQLSANFIASGAQKNRQLEKMEATGNVKIITPTETIKGDKGFYNKLTNQAELSGNVSVVRGQNILKGEVATVDLNTNVSTLSGGKNTGGRVSGVFYPE